MSLLDIPEFKADPDKYTYDHLLKGKYKHYCWEWDEMAIDETCPEFLSCTCFKLTDTEWNAIQKNLLKYIMTEDRRHNA